MGLIRVLILCFYSPPPWGVTLNWGSSVSTPELAPQSTVRISSIKWHHCSCTRDRNAITPHMFMFSALCLHNNLLNKINTMWHWDLHPPPFSSFLLPCLFCPQSLKSIFSSLSSLSAPLPPPSLSPIASLAVSRLIPALPAPPPPAGAASRWVFSGCYDLRDDNGSYNVASRSWCGWACGGILLC